MPFPESDLRQHFVQLVQCLAPDCKEEHSVGSRYYVHNAIPSAREFEDELHKLVPDSDADYFVLEEADTGTSLKKGFHEVISL